MNLFIPEQFPRNGFAHAAVGRHYRLASLRDFAQIKWRLWHGRSTFSLMPFRAFAMLERRQSSENVQPSLGDGLARRSRRKGRSKRCYAMPRRLVPSAHTKVSLSRYWQTALPRHPPPSLPLPTPRHRSGRVTSNIPPYRRIARFSFALLRSIDEGKIRHVARESRYLLCNLCKVWAIPDVARILMARGKINRCDLKFWEKYDLDGSR